MTALLTATDLPARLTLILHTLCRAIAARAGRERAVVPVALRVWPYLHRLAARFSSLVGRIRAGHIVVPRARPRAASAPRPRAPCLPRGFAWLIRLAPEAAPFGSQLQALLAEPEFSALLAADPRPGRVLRPLCRMLGLAPGPDLPAALFTPPVQPAPVPEKSTPHTWLDTGAPPTPGQSLPNAPASPKPPPPRGPLEAMCA